MDLRSNLKMLEIISVGHSLSNFEPGGKKQADTVPRTLNYHFVKLLATAIATPFQETVNAYPKKLLRRIPMNNYADPRKLFVLSCVDLRHLVYSKELISLRAHCKV